MLHVSLDATPLPPFAATILAFSPIAATPLPLRPRFAITRCYLLMSRHFTLPDACMAALRLLRRHIYFRLATIATIFHDTLPR